MNKAIIEIAVTDEQIDNFLCGAFEGGSNYWCGSIKVKDNDYKGTDYASECVSKGGIIEVHRLGIASEFEPITISKKDIIRGLELMSINGYKKSLNRLLFGDYDSDDCDNLFQMACFKEVIYG